MYEYRAEQVEAEDLANYVLSGNAQRWEVVSVRESQLESSTSGASRLMTVRTWLVISRRPMHLGSF